MQSNGNLRKHIRTLVSTGKSAQAEVFLRQNIEDRTQYDLVPVVVELCSLLSRQGRARDALLLTNAMLATYPNTHEYFGQRGWTHLRLENFDSAIENFRAALDLHSSIRGYRAGLIEALAYSRRFDEAFNAVPKQENSETLDIMCLASLGICNRLQGSLPSSRKVLRQAVERQPHDFRSLEELGITLVTMSITGTDNRWRHALNMFDRALAICPDSVRSQQGRSLAFGHISPPK